jgi:predicted AAA+ superfamily ATPase
MVIFKEMKLLSRPEIIQEIKRAIREYPVTLVLGPRQCGKTTLARQISKDFSSAYFDLEDPATPLRPEISALTLKELRGLVVIDEFHRQPHLFEYLRVLSDRRPLPARFLILGSASPELVRGVSESLAGRIAYVSMGGFVLGEAGEEKSQHLWARGGFPRSFLARTDEESYRWRINFVHSFLERDIPQLGIRIPSTALFRFWTMLAHLHGQNWNAADLARSMGVKEDTARRYLDILTGSFMMRQLHPWFENVGKRVVKAPKVYFRDSGILHALLGLRNRRDILSHPKLGFSWEGYALEQIIRAAGAEKEAFFYKTHAGAELDLLLIRKGKRYGFEFKYESAPQATKSMHIVAEDLRLDHLWVIYPGETTYRLSKDIEVFPLVKLNSVLARIA